MRQQVALGTIVRKEVVRWSRIWKQTLLPSVITSVLYFLIFGNFIGSRIGDVRGVEYIAFIIPGLVMMAIITNSYSNTVSSFYGSKFQRSIEELLISPTKTSTIILGYSLGAMGRALIVGLLVGGVGMLFYPLALYNVAIIILFALLTSFLFSMTGLINAVYAKSFDDVGFVPTFILTPLTYLGGVFYSIEALSPFWQGVSKFNPVLYLVDGFRYGFLGVSDVNVWVSLLGLTAFTVVIGIVTYNLIDKGVGLKE
jgi:ABC-2 type transport system permease protein